MKGGNTVKEQNGTIFLNLLFMLFKLVAMFIFDGIVVSLMGDVIYDKTINVSNEDG